MAFFCNFCNFIDERQSSVSLTNKDSEIRVGINRIYQLDKNESLNNYTKIFEKEKLNKSIDSRSSQDLYNEGNSIFEMRNPYICLFCGGESCKYENPSKDIKSDIDGLIANLYFDCVYASQRICTKLIKQNNLIEIFKKKNIKLIVNCQVNGEHPYCGPNNGLEKDSGFSYSPSIFISEGIKVLCKGFQDLTPPHTFDFMLDIVRKMAYIVKYKKGRVLVHCHAGNGRTGVVNVCFFIFYFNYNYQEALNEVRKLRKKGVEKPLQELYCQKFEQYIKDIKNLFPNQRRKLGDFIKNQHILDFNFDKNITIFPSIVISYYFENKNKKIKNANEIYKKIIKIDFIPDMIFKCIEKIAEIKILEKIRLKELYNSLNGKIEINDEGINEIKRIIQQLKQYNWEDFNKLNDMNIISEILFMWMNNNVIHCISPQKIEKIINELIVHFLPKNEIKQKGTISTNENIFNNLQTLFKQYINNIRYKIEMRKMVIIIKDNLNKIEYELIKYLSLFLQIIYPSNKSDENLNNENDDEFKRFLTKFNIFLLGYNLDIANSNPKISESIDLLHSKMLTFIFELFIFYFNDDEVTLPSEEEDIFFCYKNKVDFKNIEY